MADGILTKTKHAETVHILSIQYMAVMPADSS